tara:strand:- start:347 stop:562 length:216 start_codon:yes stop_codon:yes gene_type:complete
MITSKAITITNICINIVGTVSDSNKNGFVKNTAIYLLFRSWISSILTIIDQPRYIDIFLAILNQIYLDFLI